MLLLRLRCARTGACDRPLLVEVDGQPKVGQLQDVAAGE
jgi:hypothetical protein